MYFDGASQREPGSGRDAPKTRAGAGVVFLTPEKGVLHYSFTLLKDNFQNNEAEYEALSFGVEIALDIGIRVLYVFGDSQLIIRRSYNRMGHRPSPSIRRKSCG